MVGPNREVPPRSIAGQISAGVSLAPDRPQGPAFETRAAPPGQVRCRWHDVRVLYAYVDESERDDSFYFLGATICTDDQRDELSERLNDLMERHALSAATLSPSTELHGSTMMRAAEDPWRSVPMRLRFKIFRDALEAIEQSGTRVYIEGVNIYRQLARGYPNPTPARELAFSHLFERINECCHNDEPRIKVVADEHHTSEISRSNFSRYRNVGTYGYRSSRLPNIDQNIEFVTSHSVRPLQAADLVTYLYNRLTTVQETDQRAHEMKRDLWSVIDPAVMWPRGRARIWPTAY